MKRSQDEISSTSKSKFFSLQFNIRGAAIRKTGQFTEIELDSDESIDSNKIYAFLSTKILPSTLSCYEILYYDCNRHGWEVLKRDVQLSTNVLKNSCNNNSSPILDVLLDDVRQLPTVLENSDGDSKFAIGVWHGKTAYNLVSLRRSASQLGASFVFSIADRMKNKKPLKETFPGENTAIPIYEYSSLLHFSLDTIKDEYEWVCIEMGGKPLSSFVHPKRALYILGSEDNGISTMLKGACKHVICLDAKRSQSFNVAVAGSMVMYDRYVKSLDGGSGSGSICHSSSSNTCSDKKAKHER
jgi:tRNA(Leu) C34 or U34 (ribose-2'-O)-methylase TrmL